jgi:hypothetical protein
MSVAGGAGLLAGLSLVVDVLARLVVVDKLLEMVEASTLSVETVLDVVVSQSSQLKLPECVQLAGMVGIAKAELVEVDETLRVQSNQALPFSEGQAGYPATELVKEVVGSALLVVAASTEGRVEAEVDETVQSNQALPFSDGHGQ